MEPVKLIDILKLPLRYIVFLVIVLLIATSILLFSPEIFLTTLGLDQLVINYKMWIGLLFTVSLSIILLMVVFAVFLKLNERINECRRQKLLRERLFKLTEEEKEILSYYIDNQTKSQNLSYTYGVVKSLERNLIIYRASTLSAYGDSFAYNIQPWAWDYLNKNPKLLK